MSVALSTPQRQWLTEAPGGPQASARLIPIIQEMMAQAACPWATLDAIAFGRGPGAFTGLRTACSVAQGLAFGAGKPVLALDSLMAVAQDAVHCLAGAGSKALTMTPPVWVAMDARMGEIYAAQYQWHDNQWLTLTPPHLCTPQALNQRWHAEPAKCVAGTALGAFGDQLDTGAAERVPQALPRPQALVPLAQQAWRRGELVQARHAVPTYVRDRVAQTTAEREALKAVAGG